MSLQAFAGELLSFLERREERLLSWGFYRVRWTLQEAVDAFAAEAPTELQTRWEEIQATGRTLEDVLRAMEVHRLLYRVPGDEEAYRTRFAEGVRLLANLRQMFRADQWATAPHLVSDVKLHLAARTYPRRDQPAAAVWERLRDLCPPPDADLMKRCFDALAAGRGGAPIAFAGFQVRAFAHILGQYGSPGFSGSVICAGTGSGKTKAFYIPAFLGMVPELASPPFTKIIAIYPRNVLLADQLREAIAEAAKLRPVLLSVGRRPIRFGALLGDTPYERYFQSGSRYGWKRRGSGWVVPFLKSPVDGRSDLLWREVDRQAGRTCLYREGAAEPDVPDATLALTREQLSSAPPDVLFLSLEMLNREMSNPQWEATFGMRRPPGRSPRLLLLDEVHAHQGLAGAQVAWVLRRWRHWSKIDALHVTGLSATLRDAPLHLSRVASLSPKYVEEFRPRPGLDASGEMEAEGMEYNLALKGDPASGSSLLATSIQVGMLLARLLTPRSAAPGGGPLRPEEFFRKKVFGFSDNLDAVNRWFSNMVDAETNLHLARLRASPAPNAPPDPLLPRKLQEGQIWQLPERLGHRLNAPLVVTRCSSQDPGADANSDLIIATSSLEVGFDDPEVGAVLHHKRPGSMSSFIQRRGRAGRTRGARPWTVVVLSDYGADRWAFQSAEQLFQPEVDALILPISNPYVLRVQAALFLVDWIGRQTPGGQNAFQYLQGPNDYSPTRAAQASARRQLHGILEGGAAWKKLRGEFWYFFRRYSGLKEEAAAQMLDDLLWHEPRPLLTKVIPTLLRKLEADWQRAYPIEGQWLVEDAGARRPLPQFIPKATFFDLDVGEATLELEAYGERLRESESLPVPRLMFEACPGRVSKRFAVATGEPGYWHGYSPRLQDGDNTASVEALFPCHTFLESVGGVNVFQPDAAAAVHRPRSVEDTSNASWTWHTLARRYGQGEVLPLHESLPWREVFAEARAFLHSSAEWLEILRHTSECGFEMRRDRQSVAGTLRLQRDPAQTEDGGGGVAQAVGFRNRVDGFRFVVSAAHLAVVPTLTDEMRARFRVDYFIHRIKTSPVLRPLVNSFRAEWLAQISLAMLTATALRRNTGLPAAQAALGANRIGSARRVLDAIFQVQGINAQGGEESARLKTALLELWSNPDVRNEIAALEPIMWSPLGPEFDDWVRQRHAATLAQALRAAMISMAPQVAEDDLAVDVIAHDDGGRELLVSELSPGGLGQVETIARAVQREPRRFLDALEYALVYCSREQGVANLLGVADRAATQARTGGLLEEAFTLTRQAQGFTSTEVAKTELQGALQAEGFFASRELMVAVVTKLLRPASSALTDRMVSRFNRAWRRRSARLGVDIPLRTFAYVCTQNGTVRRHLDAFLAGIGGGGPEGSQTYSQLQQLLLETCHDSCPECLQQPNMFYDFGRPSRALARAWLTLEVEEIPLETYPDDWAARATVALRARGRVRLSVAEGLRPALVAGLPALVATEIDLHELRVPVVVSRVEQTGGRWVVTLHIPDYVHG